MKLHKTIFPFLAAGCLALGLTPNVQAQGTGAHIAYVYPAGGKQGTTLQLRIGGQMLDGVTNVFVSGQGVKGSVVNYKKPLTPNQANLLREELKKLQDRRAAAARSKGRFTPEDLKQLEEIRKKLAGFQRRPANPAMAEIVTVKLEIEPSALPGRRELRLGARLGLSNPMVFCVGTLPEFRKPEPDTDEAPPLRARRQPGASAADPTETRVTLPATVNGQMLPGGTDRFRFSARKGQQLVAAVSARDLIPYLADAVPGWFQATLTLRDAAGREVAYDDDFQFRPDPVIACEIPRDGDYILEIKDAIYRGREDFVYRMNVGELPFVTGIFPMGGRAGETAGVQVRGWNLPATNLLVSCGSAAGVHSLATLLESKPGTEIYEPVAFETGALPEVLESEPNDAPAEATPVVLPVIANGTIGRPGDLDVLSFEGQAGQTIVAEIMARRLNSPLDSLLKLADSAGRQIAVNDDHDDPASGLNTHHADSALTATLPAAGRYYITISDVQRRGGPEYAWRLRLGAPQPDFSLRVVPSSLTLRAGAEAALTVYALRKEGFTNAIQLELDNAPPGFSLAGARIPEGADRVRITLGTSAGATGDGAPARLSLTGTALTGSTRLTRPAVPAEDMMQAFFYKHLVPSQELDVMVTGRGLGRGGLRLLDPGPIRIPAGGTARVRVSAPGPALADRFQLQLDDPPPGLTLREVVPGPRFVELVLESDAAKAKPGTAGNLIVGIAAGAGDKTKKAANAARRAAVACLPAIPFQVIEPPR